MSIQSLKSMPIEARRALALRVGTNLAYMYQIANGDRQASPQLANRIHQATNGAVRREELRPDIYAD